jgi:PAS domain S-box-containing protein
MTYRFRTERKEDEELISGKEIIYTLDLAGNFTFLNEVGERFSGYSCDEACRMNITQVVAPELAEYVRQQITQTVREWFGAVYEIEIITKDHRRVALETSTHVVWRDGQPIEIQGIALAPIARTRALPDERVRCLDREFRFGMLFQSGLA